MDKTICKVCGKEFIGRSNKIYCSNDCSIKIGRLRARNSYKSNWKPIKINCSFCKKEFIKKQPNNKFCSKDCQRKSQYKFFDKMKDGIYLKNGKSYNYYKLRFEVFKRDNFTCQYCGRNVKEDKIKIHCDHIIPRSKGGKFVFKNLITSCEECNLGKRDVLLEEKRRIKCE